MVRRSIAGLVLEKAADYAPKLTDADYIRKSDVPWLDRFAKAGGHAVISGDVKMRTRDHERLCLYQHGFVTIFFEQQWNDWSGFRKMAILLHWWEEVVTKIKTADRGTFWAIPTQWPTKGGELRNASFGLAQLLKDSPNKGIISKPRRQKKAASPSRLTPHVDDRQGGLLTILEDAHDRRKSD